MDDKRFDDIIRGKVERFKDTGHDANALTDLRTRLSNLPAKKSRWSNGKMGYVAGSMLLFTLINFGIVWYFSEGRHAALSNEIELLKEERSQIIGLQSDLSALKTLNNHQTDTVYIYRDRLTTNITGLAGTDHQGTNIRGTENFSDQPLPETGSDLKEYHELLANNPEISEELEEFLTEQNLLLTGDQGEMILIVHNQAVVPVNEYGMTNSTSVVGSGIPDNLSEVTTFEPFETKKTTDQIKVDKKKIPAKVLWSMEKHNYKGVDFQYGVEGKYHKSNYDVGVGGVNGGIGFMTEVIFSPILRLETGIHFGARSYRIGETEINQLPAEFFEDYPGFDDQLGEPISMESDANLIKVPLNLKLYGPIDHNKKWYVSAGVTPQWASKQEFDYKYALNVIDPPTIGDEFVSFVGTKQETSTAFYTTTLNVGAGTEVKLNKNLRWQLGLFYQKGLSDAGYENRKLENSFGVKSSIWFNRP